MSPQSGIGQVAGFSQVSKTVTLENGWKSPKPTAAGLFLVILAMPSLGGLCSVLPNIVFYACLLVFSLASSFIILSPFLSPFLSLSFLSHVLFPFSFTPCWNCCSFSFLFCLFVLLCLYCLYIPKDFALLQGSQHTSHILPLRVHCGYANIRIQKSGVKWESKLCSPGAK